MFGSAAAREVISRATGLKRGFEQLHRLLLKKSKANSQHGGCAVANNAFTDSRESATIVKTPRIVPKGMKRHSMQATTSTEEKALRRERHPPAMRIQMAIVTPTREKNAPSKIKIQPRNAGGSSWLPGPG